MKSELISQFYSEDKKRRSIIWRDKYHWVVDLCENGDKIETRLITGKTLRFAEDLAQNFVEYIGEFKE